MLHMIYFLIGALTINSNLLSRASAQTNIASAPSSSSGRKPFSTYSVPSVATGSTQNTRPGGVTQNTIPIPGGTIQTIKNPSGTSVIVQQTTTGNNRPTFVAAQQSFTSGNSNQTSFVSTFSGNNPSTFNQFLGANSGGFNQFGSRPSGFNQFGPNQFGSTPFGFNQFGFNQFGGNNNPSGFNQFGGSNQFFTNNFGFAGNQNPYTGGFVPFVPPATSVGNSPQSNFPTNTINTPASGGPISTPGSVVQSGADNNKPSAPGAPFRPGTYVPLSPLGTAPPAPFGAAPFLQNKPYQKPGSFIPNVPLEILTSNAKPNIFLGSVPFKGPHQPNTFIPNVPFHFANTERPPISQSFTPEGTAHQTIFPVKSPIAGFSPNQQVFGSASQTTSPNKAPPSFIPQPSPPGLSLSISGLLGLTSLPSKIPIFKPNPTTQPLLSFLTEFSSSNKKPTPTPTIPYKPPPSESNIVPFEPIGPFRSLYPGKSFPTGDSSISNRPASAYGLPGNF